MHRLVISFAVLCALVLAVLAGRAQRERPAPFSSHDDCGTEGLVARATSTGHAASWRLPRRPPRACEVVLELHATAAVGPAALVDARGRHLEVAATRDGDRVRFHLSRELLDAAAFPAVLDPWVSPAVSTQAVREVPAGNAVTLATNGTEWLALGGSATAGSLLTRIDPTGAVGAQAILRGPSWAVQLFGYTDRYVTLSPAGMHRGRTWAELVDSGVEPNPPGYDLDALWLAASDAGIMYTLPATLADGGPGLELHRLLPDLSGDGAPPLLVEGNAQGFGTLEGDTFYMNVFSPSNRLLVARLDLQSARVVLLPDGGEATPGQLVSTGALTLLTWAEVDGVGFNSLLGVLLRQGDPVGPVQLLARWPSPLSLVALGWDERVFHVVFTRSDDQLLEVQVMPDGGAPLAAVPLETAKSRHAAVWLSSTPHATLLVRRSGWVDDPAPRASVLPLAPPAPLDGGALLFHAPNTAGFPSLAWRGTALLAAWNDTRFGADVSELWGRRFDTALQPIDADSVCLSFIDRTLPHSSFNTGWRTLGPQFLAATPTGWLAVRTDSFDITVHRLDASGRPVGAELQVSAALGLDTSPAVAANDSAAFITWLRFSGGFVGTVLGADGGLSPEVSIGPSLLSTVATRTGFVTVAQHDLATVNLTGAGPTPLATFPSSLVLAAASNGDALLVVERSGTSTVTARTVELDGGVGAPELIGVLPGVFDGQLAWDGRRYVGLLVVDDGDGGLSGHATMRRPGDAGWVSPAPVALSGAYAVAAVPDAGLVLAAGNDELVLRRIDWFSNGTPCGANAECENGLCVDGVCCDATCGGGAVDCVACSKAAGGPVDGVCSALPANQVCRPAAGACDAPEVCDGLDLACPADTLIDAGVTCRPLMGLCDVAEWCDGVSAACPAQTVAGAGVSCRAAADSCDVEDRCDGFTTACPDVRATAGPSCVTPRGYPVGCGCSGGAGGLSLLVLLLAAGRARRR